MDSGALKQVFAQRGWLSGHPAEFKATIIGMGRLVELDRGDPLYHAGDPAGGVYGIAAGSVAVHGGTQWQESVLANILRAGDWFGQGPVLSGGQRAHGYRATEPTILLQVPLARLESKLREEPEFARRVGQMADIGVRIVSQVARDLLTPDSSRRLAAVLLRVTAMGDVPPADASGYVITQSELGEMANLSRSQVNAALRRFRESGWIAVGYNRIQLLHVTGLKAFAYGEG